MEVRTMYVWGGKAWKRLVDGALVEMGDLTGKSVLEIGFHDGEMSREFARRGATVTAVDVNRRAFEAVKPATGVTFLHYDGNLDSIGGTFDFVFTKSVLVHAGLRHLPAISRKLKSTGRVVFIENGRGGWYSEIARRLRHPGKSFAHLDYFTQEHIARIAEWFDIEVGHNVFPPVYLVIGQARAAMAENVGSGVETVTPA